MSSTNKNSIPDITLLGHPAGLFVLFFTEMWERFSYYGMRALLVLFLVSEASKGGWSWTSEEAGKLYALYTGLVYVTPIFGGMIADRWLGFRKAVLVGAILMTAGHASMAIETEFFFYMGLTLLILGNGMFKPNVSSIVGGLYPEGSDKKDGAYTIFYMGINAGAFLGILLCGYIGEKVGWSYGFGLAGIFMFAGMIQFWFGQGILGTVGLSPKEQKDNANVVLPVNTDEHVLDNVENVQKAESNVSSDKGAIDIRRIVIWALIAGATAFGLWYFVPMLLPEVDEWVGPVIIGCMVGIIGFILTDPKLQGVSKDRVVVVVILAIFTIFFWWAFEQAGSSMTIFAKNFTERELTGSGAEIFKWVNALLTIVPLGVITYVLAMLVRRTMKFYAISAVALSLSFAGIWAIAIWMIYREFSADQSEVPASWFGILNSLFIIIFAPLFSRLWETKFNPPATVKFALGLILLGIGFGILSFGAMEIPTGAEAGVVRVSMIWLVLAYLLHTLGELVLSPVGLSYVSKLTPGHLLGIIFGVWFGATAVANYLGGMTASFIEPISEKVGLSGFFLIFMAIPIAAGFILILLTPIIKKKMHGIK
ncbi:MAG: peptide MFS transporter [Crocinitomicaceae bacterium]